MELFLQFINEYGTTILYTVLTAIAGYLGIVAKKLFTEWFNTKTKEKIARESVLFAEQVYKHLHGDEKLAEAMKAASQMLAEKGIIVSELELHFLIESAVGEFNKAFENTKVEAVETDEPLEDIELPKTPEVTD